MAIGDAAKAAGYSLVPNTGDEGLVKLGAREINRTRDYIAAVRPPANKAAYRTASGISSGTAVPSNSVGNDGDIYFRII